MKTIAIDPGPAQSQILAWDGERVLEKWLLPNEEARNKLRELADDLPSFRNAICIEGVACYGMPVGKEVFETCFQIGRMLEICAAANQGCQLVYRMDVKMHLCHSARAKDGNIRQAIVDRFGGKDAAIGKKASPGPLFGVTSHAWAALALAITFHDKRSTQPIICGNKC